MGWKSIGALTGCLSILVENIFNSHVHVTLYGTMLVPRSLGPSVNLLHMISLFLTFYNVSLYFLSFWDSLKRIKICFIFETFWDIMTFSHDLVITDIFNIFNIFKIVNIFGIFEQFQHFLIFWLPEKFFNSHFTKS